MLTLRASAARFPTRIGWLDSRHSFSFGEHYDPDHMGFGALRVINEDWVAGGAGFPPHPHKNMEIITIVLEGALAHEDDTGGGSVIRPGDVQKMSAGTGIRHSEFNASKTERVHLYQIWIEPNIRGVAPGYAQIHFARQHTSNTLGILASPRREDAALPLYQDATLYRADLDAGRSLTHAFLPGRRAWVQQMRGTLTVNGHAIAPGDGLAITDETALTFAATEDAAFLLFDMA